MTARSSRATSAVGPDAAHQFEGGIGTVASWPPRPWRLDGRCPRPGERRRARPAADRRRSGRVRDPGLRRAVALHGSAAVADEAHATLDAAAGLDAELGRS